MAALDLADAWLPIETRVGRVNLGSLQAKVPPGTPLKYITPDLYLPTVIGPMIDDVVHVALEIDTSYHASMVALPPAFTMNLLVIHTICPALSNS